MTNFDGHPWHNSIQDLWSTKWDFLARAKVYPFNEWTVHSDYERIFNKLGSSFPGVSANGFDEDTWASFFLPEADEIYAEAQSLELSGNFTGAYSTYMCSIPQRLDDHVFPRRAAGLYRVGYFPWVGRSSTSEGKLKCWAMDKTSIESAMKQVSNQVTLEP
ncbi:hypothetical protein IE53DRAFT_368885 [Violaceomyces palustris]|uniref:Uncharacterized protein n=1 Tax=Violaceomyces palustris TaxID=1673888 RepID=A0ACD0NXA6_9BASI|nr:hypothetical protein IE53DRAFT_368885 [Violaceomyces palustris]